LIYEDDNNEWQAKDVAAIGDASKIPLPVDISISSDDNTLWVNTFMDGKTRSFDISNPHAPTQVFEQEIGKQVNMVSSSWDGTRLYYTSSLLANWDKKGESQDQYLRAFNWDGKALTKTFDLDFIKLGLGFPHQMRFGSNALYGKGPSTSAEDIIASLAK
jgi:selenium-binding protein 1